MEDDVKELRQKVEELAKHVTDARIAIAVKDGGQKATGWWAAGVAIMIAAWLGATSVWHIPHLVRATASGKAAEEAANAATSAKTDAATITELRTKTERNNGIIPAGTIVAFGGPLKSVPKGWAACDGTIKKIQEFPELYAAIGSSWGGDKSSTFNLPDLQGRFLRGTDNATGRDPDVSLRVAVNTGGNTQGDVGSLQSDAFQSHVHLSNADAFSTAYTPATRIATSGNSGGVQNQKTGPPISDETHGNPRVSSETRPVNVYVNYIIKL